MWGRLSITIATHWSEIQPVLQWASSEPGWAGHQWALSHWEKGGVKLCFHSESVETLSVVYSSAKRKADKKSPADCLWTSSTSSRATEEKLQLWLQGRSMCFLKGVNFIISALIRNEGCEQFLLWVFFFFWLKSILSSNQLPVLGELWEQGELFSTEHWKAIKTDPKYDCAIYSIIHLNGIILVNFLNQ